MNIYIGSHTASFKIDRSLHSRYGIPALFFTTNIELATLYARHHAKRMGVTTGGFVVQYEIPENNIHSVDYGYRSSFSYQFRNLVFKLRLSQYKVVIIKNVFDRPSEDVSYPSNLASDIVVLFKFDILSKKHIVLSNVG